MRRSLKIITFVNDINKQMLTKNNERYPLRTEKNLYRTCFFCLAPPAIHAADASIKRRIVVNDYGAYSRAARFNIFVLICGA